MENPDEKLKQSGEIEQVLATKFAGNSLGKLQSWQMVWKKQKTKQNKKTHTHTKTNKQTNKQMTASIIDFCSVFNLKLLSLPALVKAKSSALLNNKERDENEMAFFDHHPAMIRFVVVLLFSGS